MPLGLLASLLCHGTLLLWAFWSMHAVKQFDIPDTPSISAAIVTPSEFLRLKQGSEDAKKLETKANDKPTPDDSKNDTKKPENASPPPPPAPEVAAVEPPKPPEPPPEPPKVEPVKPPEPDPIAKKIDEPPPPPEPAPGPTPEEQKLLEQKIEEQRKADEAKKLEEEAAKKAEEEARKKKLAEEAKKKKLAEAKRKADEAKKFNDKKISDLLNKIPDDAEKQSALLDKDPRKKGQQAAGSSQVATAAGKEAGTATGSDTVLSAREQDLLKGQIEQQLARCSKMPGGGGGIDTPVVWVEWKVRQDGSLDGEPVVLEPQNTPLFKIAAEASVNAVRNCPLSLPPEQYATWSKITWLFNWPKILGLR